MVNPYDIESTADAVCQALEMVPEERSARMLRLRKVVKEQNIYRWAGNLVADLCEVRLKTADEHGSRAQAQAASQGD
jgi:trehalose-6-phosphate synthase